MKIGVLGSGVVGSTVGAKLLTLGHDVMMGSRSATNEKAAAWVKKAGARASQGTFADAAAHGEIVFNCTAGTTALDALKAARTENHHDVFVSGNDPGAKGRVTEMLQAWFGWKNVVDLGDITTARGVESYVVFWVRLWGALKTADFNIKVLH